MRRPARNGAAAAAARPNPASTDGVITDRVITDRVITDGVMTDRVITDRVITDGVITDRVITDRVITDGVITGLVITDSGHSRIGCHRPDPCAGRPGTAPPPRVPGGGHGAGDGDGPRRRRPGRTERAVDSDGTRWDPTQCSTPLREQ